MLVIMNLNDILQRSYKMTKTKKITEKDIVDKEENITYMFPDDATTQSWTPASETYTVSYGVTPSGASIGTTDTMDMTDMLRADAGKGMENFTFDDYVPPRPFEDSVPSLKDIEEMCAEYPSLKIAYDKFRNVFRICYDDWKTKTGGDQF